LHLLSRPHRPRRSGEWSSAKAVTFIVTLAATQSVTLAARKVGMSRKSAYALRSRDPAFAAAWDAAGKAERTAGKGYKVAEVEGCANSPNQGDRSVGPAPSIWSTAQRDAARHMDAMRRDRFFARLAQLSADSRSLARDSSDQ
jgi:hypothetical protein